MSLTFFIITENSYFLLRNLQGIIKSAADIGRMVTLPMGSLSSGRYFPATFHSTGLWILGGSMAQEWKCAAERGVSYQSEFRSRRTQCWQLVAAAGPVLESYWLLQTQEESSWPGASSRSIGSKTLYFSLCKKSCADKQGRWIRKKALNYKYSRLVINPS